MKFKYLHDFQSYLMVESFDLSVLYKKQNIIPEIQNLAKSIVEDKFDKATEIPNDMIKNRDKVELWLAKQIKVICLTDAKYWYDIEYKSYNSFKGTEKEHDTRHVEECAYLLDVLKGKNTDKYTFSVVVDELYNGDLSAITGHKKMLLDDFINRTFIDKYTSKLIGIFDYFLSPMRNQHETINLVTTLIDEMYYIQAEWHRNLKASGKIFDEDGRILKTYPDGFYWIDLETNSSPEEGDAMGHCGTTSADTLLSLRKRSDGGFKEPFVTIAINYQDNQISYDSIHQIKGKNNTKPVSKYHPYIVDLLLDKKLDIQTVANDEYNTEEDFHIVDLEDESKIRKILEEKPDMFNNILDYIQLGIKGILDEEEVNLHLNTLDERLSISAKKVYCHVDSLMIFKNLFKRENNKYGYRSADHQALFERFVKALDNPNGFYDDELVFEFEWQYNLLSKDDVDNILNRIDITELDDLGEDDIETLTDADIDMDNILDDIRNNDNKFKEKLAALLSLTDIYTVQQIIDVLNKALRETQNKTDRLGAKEYLLKVIGNTFDGVLVENGNGYTLDVTKNMFELGYQGWYFIEDMYAAIEIDTDEIYGNDLDDDYFRDKLKELLKDNFDKTL
jgi:hypothetical protein